MPSHVEEPKPAGHPLQEFLSVRWLEDTAEWDEHMSTIEDAFRRHSDMPAAEATPSSDLKFRKGTTLTSGQKTTMRRLYEEFKELKRFKPKKPAKATGSDLHKLEHAVKRAEELREDLLTVVGEEGDEVAVESGSE